MSGAYDLRLIVQYFGRAAVASAAAAMKVAKPAATLETTLEAAAVAGLRRTKSRRTAAQVLAEGAHPSRATRVGQSRAMSTMVSTNASRDEPLSAFELQQFGLQMPTCAANAMRANH